MINEEGGKDIAESIVYTIEASGISGNKDSSKISETVQIVGA